MESLIKLIVFYVKIAFCYGYVYTLILVILMKSYYDDMHGVRDTHHTRLLQYVRTSAPDMATVISSAKSASVKCSGCLTMSSSCGREKVTAVSYMEIDTHVLQCIL